MSIRKTRRRAIIPTVLKGLLLLAIPSLKTIHSYRNARKQIEIESTILA